NESLPWDEHLATKKGRSKRRPPKSRAPDMHHAPNQDRAGWFGAFWGLSLHVVTNPRRRPRLGA
ncbi:MAG TPA: hypothetical protein VG164_09730, partial [Trebonia sp.]|nr:hypothetical protein [Trebonia sp.]